MIEALDAEQQEEEVLAVSDDAPRSARKRDCDLMAKNTFFFALVICRRATSSHFSFSSHSLPLSSSLSSHLCPTHAPSPAHARRSIIRRQRAGEKKEKKREQERKVERKRRVLFLSIRSSFKGKLDRDLGLLEKKKKKKTITARRHPPRACRSQASQAGA